MLALASVVNEEVGHEFGDLWRPGVGQRFGVETLALLSLLRGHRHRSAER